MVRNDEKCGETKVLFIATGRNGDIINNNATIRISLKNNYISRL